MGSANQDVANQAVDRHVGAQLRLRRTLKGLSQEEVGLAVGVTFQQVQKYENGVNRISASRLWDFANLLDVPVNSFFEGLEARSAPPITVGSDIIDRRETLDFVRNFRAIPDEAQQLRLKNLIRSLAGEGDDSDDQTLA